MEFPFPSLSPYLTQVNSDSREKLDELIATLIGNKGRPLVGYAVSQNLLNASRSAVGWPGGTQSTTTRSRLRPRSTS